MTSGGVGRLRRAEGSKKARREPAGPLSSVDWGGTGYSASASFLDLDLAALVFFGLAVSPSSSSPLAFWALEMAAPRISPRLAPESDEPNSSSAFLSSSTSRA